MRDVTYRPRFRSDLRRQLRRGSSVEELIAAVELLAETGTLPDGYLPHILSGELSGLWECHIDADWLLIYDVTEQEVILYRTGSHADLFE